VTVTRHLIFLLAAIVCFLIGLILAIGWVDNGNDPAFLFGGLALFAAAHLP
jgi:hypothetical protein